MSHERPNRFPSPSFPVGKAPRGDHFWGMRDLDAERMLQRRLPLFAVPAIGPSGAWTQGIHPSRDIRGATPFDFHDRRAFPPSYRDMPKCQRTLSVQWRAHMGPNPLADHSNIGTV